MNSDVLTFGGGCGRQQPQRVVPADWSWLFPGAEPPPQTQQQQLVGAMVGKRASRAAPPPAPCAAPARATAT